MKNCRNCKWAEWQLSTNGRRLFGNYAQCVYPVIVTLPASRFEMKRRLTRPVPVCSHDNKPVDCDAWEKQVTA